ncbi:hypothetical protein ACFQZI_12155 [Mucilaginibacter lutimaris]|uniref:Uncharacterized protein n=1 Tax=Mucilaginibacter lutimaris TaxID=931629 RepID=A0ABW2ZHJ1_9SPHI
MFNLFKSTPQPEFNIPGVGVFYQLKHSGRIFWSITTDIFSIGQDVSLTSTHLITPSQAQSKFYQFKPYLSNMMP